MIFELLAKPWWVNLLILIPFAAYAVWRRRPLVLDWRQLAAVALFALAFGFVEATVVVYLRAAVGLLPGYGGTLADAARLSADLYQQSDILGELPRSLLTVELWRETATMVMLASVAYLAAPRRRERWALWLFVFALWDIAYYAGLWATVRWPSSLLSPDVLFLIPVPWLAQVWYPLLVSTLMVIAVLSGRERRATAL